MKTSAVAVLVLLSIATAAAQSFSGQTFVFGADIAARVNGDISATTGYTRFRTLNGDTAFFESALNNAQAITAVHIHLQPQRGVVDGGPLVLALTNTSSNPLSSSGNNALVQVGNVSNAQLAANPQIAAARAGIVALGIHENTLQNIGDIDRLARLGVLYGDIHSTARVSPNRVGSGPFNLLPANLGRKIL